MKDNEQLKNAPTLEIEPNKLYRTRSEYNINFFQEIPNVKPLGFDRTSSEYNIDFSALSPVLGDQHLHDDN